MAWGETTSVGCGMAANCYSNGMNQILIGCQYEKALVIFLSFLLYHIIK